MANNFRFHADHIGSLLRPQALLEARRRLEAGMIEPEELREVENEAIADAVKLQKHAGVSVITDGEFRRQDFRTGLVEAFDGFEERIVEMPWKGPNGIEKLPSSQFIVTERLQRRRRMTEGDVAYLRTLTGEALKSTLIAPGFIADRCWKDGVTDKVYDSPEELGQEVAGFIKEEIEALFDEGVSYVQLDNPGYGAYVGDNVRSGNGEENGHKGHFGALGFDAMLATDAAAVTDLRQPESAAVGMHVCRGNQGSLWLGEGSYEAVAEQLFSELPVDRFLLEFDDDRSGDFGPLRYVPEGKIVVLGLISSKSPELEDVEGLLSRIDQAAEIIEIDNLSISPQCGFASVGHGGNKLTIAEEAAKLRLVSDAALAMWGFEV